MTANQELKIELKPLSDLKVAKNNAKVHTPAQVQAIVRSIKEFGFRDPIAVTESMEIIEGHGRFLALTELKAEKAPVIVLKGLSPEQIRAYRLAHNKLTLSTDFDTQLLSFELDDLRGGGYDFTLTGFSADEMLSFASEDYTDILSPKEEKPQGEKKGPKPKVESEEGPTPATTKTYTVVFSDDPSYRRWLAWLQKLKAEMPGDTAADRIDAYLKTVLEE